jgi:DNA polymerase IIIc chi subunit
MQFRDTEASRRDHTVLEIVEKTSNARKKVVDFTQMEQRAAAIDRVPWIHKQDCFVPHLIDATASARSPIPIVIVTAEWNLIVAEVPVAGGHCGEYFALSVDVNYKSVNRSSTSISSSFLE